MKILIATGATLAMVAVASAADMPHPQPVYQPAQVGKMPIGKTPVGKSPIGKSPVVTKVERALGIRLEEPGGVSQIRCYADRGPVKSYTMSSWPVSGRKN